MKRQRKPSKQAKGSWHKWKSERDDDKAKAVIFHGHKSQEAEKNNIWQSNLSGNCRNHWYDNILGNLLAAECPGDRYDTPTESCFQFFERTSPRPRLLGVLGSKLPARVHWVHRRTDYRYSDWTNHGYKPPFSGAQLSNNRNTKADSTTRLGPYRSYFLADP